MSDANPSNPKTEARNVGDGEGERTFESGPVLRLEGGSDQVDANPQKVGDHGDGRGAGVEAGVEVNAGGNEKAMTNQEDEEDEEGEGEGEEGVEEGGDEEEDQGDDGEETGPEPRAEENANEPKNISAHDVGSGDQRAGGEVEGKDGVEEEAKQGGEQEAGRDGECKNKSDSEVTAVGLVGKTDDETMPDAGKPSSVEEAEGSNHAMEEGTSQKEDKSDRMEVQAEHVAEVVAPPLLSNLALVDFAGMLRVHANRNFGCLRTQIFWNTYMYMQLVILYACARILFCQRPSKTRLGMIPLFSAMNSML